MKCFLRIFALLFLASCGETTFPDFQCGLMTISDALPVQFWQRGCSTYNETVPKGVHEQCFCAPWNCDDEIRVQFQEDDSPDTDYYLVVRNDTDYLAGLLFSEISPGIHSVAFSPETEGICDDVIALEIFDVDDFSIILTGSSWINDDGAKGLGMFDSKTATGFTEACTGVDVFKAGAFQPAAIPVGTVLTIPVTVAITGTWTGDLTITMQLTDDLGNSRSTDSTVDPSNFTANGTYVIDFILTGAIGTSDRLYCFLSENIGSGTANVTITIPVGQVLYADSENALAYSDCLDVKLSHEDDQPTELIYYSNARNFAGLVHADISPDAEFNIRVPCRFFHEVFPEEDEAIELTSSVITTSGQIKAQKLLEVTHVPYYFHKKLMLILKHQTLTINGTSYQKEEKYEINEGNRRWPLKSATCLLTEKNSVLRNVI